MTTPREDTPYDCSPWAQYEFVDGIIAVIDFPSCWNGSGLSPADVTYPVGGACPAGFGHVIPKLSERVHFGVMNPLAIDGSLAFTLSSGPWYSLHADFWNTWQQERLDQLVADCLVANAHCGSVDATSSIEWSRQFGTQRYDLAYAAASDGKEDRTSWASRTSRSRGRPTTTGTMRSCEGTTRTATRCGPSSSGPTAPTRPSRSRSPAPACTSRDRPTDASASRSGQAPWTGSSRVSVRMGRRCGSSNSVPSATTRPPRSRPQTAACTWRARPAAGSPNNGWTGRPTRS